MSELVGRKAKDIFYTEIDEDGKKLVLAAREGRITVIKGLLSTNMVNINMWYDIAYQDNEEEDYEDKALPLFEAANNGHTDIVGLLLDNGAKPNIPNDFGDSPLKAAARKGHTQVVKLLIDSGADPNRVYGHEDTALHDAAREGQNDVIQMLLHIGADPNIINKDGETPLYNAVRNGNTDMVKMLLDGGTDIDFRNTNGKTPLNYAAFCQVKGVEQLLIERGAWPDKEYHELKILNAIREGNIRDVKSNLVSGVDATRGLTAAVIAGHKDIVVLLLSSGANPNTRRINMAFKSFYGSYNMKKSLLSLTLEEGRNDLAQILLDAGAEPNEEDQEKMEDWGCFEF